MRRVDHAFQLEAILAMPTPATGESRSSSRVIAYLTCNAYGLDARQDVI